MTCLHATEPATVYLSLAARTDLSVEEVTAALYEERSVVKQLAMRRTVFAFPRELLPAVWGSASARVAGMLTTRLAAEVESNGVAREGRAWVEQMSRTVLESLGSDGPATTAELRERLPALSSRLEISPGKSYGGSFPVAPRLLSALAADGRIVRGVNAGGWRTSRPQWELTEKWLGRPVEPMDAAAGYRVLVEQWLRTFGPGTETDLVWWLGATRSAVRRALAELGAVEVELEEGAGLVLPDDLAEVDEPEPWAALLPVLDATTMGWKQRGFYLVDDAAREVFDGNGNAGTTAWWNGRIVGCWTQDAAGVVQVTLLGEPGSQARRALEVEAERLTTWLRGERVATVYPSLLMKSAGHVTRTRP